METYLILPLDSYDDIFFVLYASYASIIYISIYIMAEVLSDLLLWIKTPYHSQNGWQFVEDNFKYISMNYLNADAQIINMRCWNDRPRAIAIGPCNAPALNRDKDDLIRDVICDMVIQYNGRFRCRGY